MNKIGSIKTLWKRIAEEKTIGLVKRGLDISSSLKMYCTYKYPEALCGVAFSFSRDIKIDVTKLQDLSELSISLFVDQSFEDSNFLLVQLNNHDSRINDIFASICWNLANSIVNVATEREGIRLVISQLHKWKELFSKKRMKPLSLQEQQGLFGELTFLRKLFGLDIAKSSSIDFWKGPYLAPQDYYSDLWAVEVKTVVSSKFPKVSINGEQQLDETSFEKLFLYSLIIEDSPLEGKSLPELVSDVREDLEFDLMASEILENKLVLSGYFDSDAEVYNSRKYLMRRELYFVIQNEFPRIRKEDLREGVSEVKYSVSLALSDDSIIKEQEVLNTIVSYEGVK